MGGSMSKDQKRMFEAMLTLPLRLSVFSQKHKVWEPLFDLSLVKQTVYDPKTENILGSVANLRWTWDDSGVKCDISYASGMLGILKIFSASPACRKKGHAARFVLDVLGLKTCGKIIVRQ